MPLKTRISQMNMNGKHQKAVRMKKIYLLGAMALMAFTACQNIETEVPSEKENGKVPMTFVASLDMDESDSKVAVDEVDTANKKLKFAWKAGDEIAIYDNLSSTPNLFTATADGTTVAFSGSVTDGATKFVAIYPYSAAESADAETGACVASFPREQTAVAGSFDPEALVATAYAEATDVNLRFRLLGALLSFKVDFDDVVYVEFSGSRPMTGKATFTSTSNGPTSVGTGTTSYKDVRISNADGSPLTKGETYYVCVRHTGSNSQEGFTARLITSDGKKASRTGSTSLTIARKKLYPLGTFSSSNVSFTYDRLAVYNEGFNLTIAGKTYNKADYGEAVELNPSQTISDARVKDVSAKVFFLKSGSNYASSGITINKDVTIVCENPNDRATITPSSSWKLQSGSLVLEGAVLDMTSLTTSGSSVSFFNNSGATADFPSLVLSKCRMAEVQNSNSMFIFQPISTYAGLCISEIAFRNCSLAMGGKFTTLINTTSNATAAWNYKKLELSDCIIYSFTGSLVKTALFSYTQNKENDASNSWVCNVDVQRNLFYDIHANGFVNNYNLGGVTVKNNLFVAADLTTDPGAGFKLIRLYGASDGSNYASKTSCEKNVYYGAMAGNRKWTLCDNPYLTGTLANPTACSSNPIVSANVATGKFTIDSEYAEYGPNPIPAP